MDISRIVGLKSEELYKELLTIVVRDPEEGLRRIEQLAHTDHYQKDYEFRITVETVRAVGITFQGDPTQVIPLCAGLVERATALQMWNLVAINHNLLGGAYQTIGGLGMALENYHHVIKVEAEHDLADISSLAYHNISLLYAGLKAYEESLCYSQQAIASVERGGEGQHAYASKKMIYLSTLAVVLCHSGRLEEAKEVLEQLQRIDPEKVKPNTSPIHDFNAAKMIYAFYTGDYAEAKRMQKEIRTLIPKENKVMLLATLGEFLVFCEKFGMDESFYREELQMAEEVQNGRETVTPTEIYAALRKYYRQTGDRKRYESINEKYIKKLEENEKDIRSRQLDMLTAVENMIRSKENMQEITSENMELKLIAEEADRHKNALQEAYQRIGMINELGQKMTSSLNLDEVLASIYHNLKENIPVDTFFLTVVENDGRSMRSVVFYENGVLQPEFEVDLQGSCSVLVECFQKNEWIVLSDIPVEEARQNRKLLYAGKKDSQSAIFMPLTVGDKIIGVCSVQDTGVNSYTEEEVSFLMELRPYLAIALNNAVRSWRLEHEIQKHLETQAELKRANQRLERLSFLDGLTQISSRRDFEIRILELFQVADEQKQKISLFMFDIDNFKLYNDTYGHLEGDEALKKVAQSIRRHLDGVNGLSARFGGEEFIGACSGLEKEECIALADRIRTDILGLGIENQEAPLGKLTISIGIALTEAVDEGMRSELMRLADVSLYQAKNSGKNRVVLNVLKKSE